LALSLLVLVVYVTGQASGLIFYLEPNTDKCLRDEVHKDILVTGDYSVGEAPGHKINILVTDSRAETLHKRENFLKKKQIHDISRAV